MAVPLLGWLVRREPVVGSTLGAQSGTRLLIFAAGQAGLAVSPGEAEAIISAVTIVAALWARAHVAPVA